MPGESPQDIARFYRSLQVPKGSGPPDYSWHQLVVRAATKVMDRYFPFCKNAIRSRKSAGVRPASTPSGIVLRAKLEQLAVHAVAQAVDARDTVTGFYD